MKNENILCCRLNLHKIMQKPFMAILLMANFILANYSLDAQSPPCSIEGYTNLGTYNGHTYFISNFTEYGPGAVIAAAATGGHLATIADAGEDGFVSPFAPWPYGAWIGYNDVAVEGSFVWETGESDTYTNWCPGEPNNCCGIGEHWTVINWFGCGWNDLYDGGIWGDYWYSLPLVVEFDGIDQDDDCDGVLNCNDVCPGGDDNGPCNATSLPSSLPASWYCSNNNNSEKIMVCHDGNTICISENAVATHLAHGDFLGPCSSCSENYAAPMGNLNFDIADDLLPGLTIYPNPGHGDFQLSFDRSITGNIQIFAGNGQLIKRIEVNNKNKLDLSLTESGVYFVQLITDQQMMTKKIMVIR